MQIIAAKDFTLSPDRQRKDFDPKLLSELTETISNKSLMHALVMRETSSGKELVAGERRMRAIENLWMLGGVLKHNGEVIPEGFFPYVTLGQLTPLQAEEAELEENLHRVDLNWRENAAAMAKLHKLRGQQAQLAGKIHTIADTAMETKGRSDGSYQEAVRKDLIVAKHLDNPEVAKAKSADEAFKILKRQETSAKNIELAVSVGKTFGSSSHSLYNKDCIEWMRESDQGIFDVILTDPPYGMGADNFSDGGGGRLANNIHLYDDSPESWRKLMLDWAPLSYKVAKNEAHAYVFCDIGNFPELSTIMKAAGWYVFRTPFICVKPNSGRVPLPEEGPRRQYEVLLYAIKNHKKTTAIYPDVITTNMDTAFQHGAQKPVALFENLLQRSVRPGDKVLDCFAGSGTIFPAAHKLKVYATGIEMNPEYYGLCLQRLKEIDQPVAPLGMALGNELKALMGL